MFPARGAAEKIVIPLLKFVFSAGIRTVEAASVLISLPVVPGPATGWPVTIARKLMLAFLVLPMCIVSLIGATVGGNLKAQAPTSALRIALAVILAASGLRFRPRRSTER